MFTTLLQRWFALALAALLATGVSAAPATNSQDKPTQELQPLTVMLEWFVNPDHGPIIVAQQLGYFAEESVQVTLQEPADPDLPPRLVAADKVDLAVYYQPSLTRAASENLPLAWVGTLIATPLNGVIVLKNGSIKSLADLKGKSIGTSSDSTEEATLDALFKPYGFSHNDVKMVNVGWNLSAALMTGRVDALMGAYRNFELNSLKIHKHPGMIFPLEEHGIPPYDELIFIANTQSANKEGIRRFLRGVERGAQFIANNPDKAWEIFKNYKPKELDNELNRLAWQDTVPHFALRPAAVDKGRYQRYAEFMKAYGEIKTLPDLSKMMLEVN